MWQVGTDAFPRSLYVLRNENGETLKTDTAPGWYRTSSRAKAERDCARLNRKEEKAALKAARPVKYEPTEAELRAVEWAKHSYPHWRKRFGGTRAEHNAERPAGWDADVWDALYLAPFGDEWMNWNVRAVRRLLERGAA